MTKFQFFKLETIDEGCPCCGKVPHKTCARCKDLLAQGYVIFIEIKDKSTIEKKFPTGYKIACLANQLIDITPGIAFIKQSHLKEFLKDEYRQDAQSLGHGRLLSEAPRHRTVRGATAGSRHSVDLHHRD